MRWLVVLLFVASAAGQVVEDPVGDVEIGAQDQRTASPYAWPAVDLLAITVEENEEAFFWTVAVSAFPADAGGNCPDAGDLRSFFRYGSAQYNVQQGIDLRCQPYGLLWENFEGDFSRRPIGTLNVTTGDATVTVEIPKTWIIDGAGTPPIAGRQLTDIRARSFNMLSLGGPDLTDPFSNQEADFLVVNDNMPDNDAEAGSYTILYGGGRGEGPLLLTSEAPYRASNGGNGTFPFVLHAVSPEPSMLRVTVLGTPPDWQVHGPSQVFADEAGSEFQIAVTTPFGHQHGGSDEFRVRIDDATGWYELDLGMHYLTVPQPAGHHPSLYFHPGNQGAIVMNTTADATGVPMSAQANDIPADELTWRACLQGDLKLGLAFDMARDGLFEALVESTVPQSGTIEGRLLHLAPGPAMQFCRPDFYRQREATELATMPATPITIDGVTGVSLPVVPVVESMAPAAGATLVAEITFTPDTMTMFNAAMQSGAHLSLPLLEYVGDLPVGLITAEEAPAPTEFEEAPDEPVEESTPAGGVALLALAAVAMAARRRP